MSEKPENTLSPYIEALKSGEDFLLARIFVYATESEYTKYTSTREEDWRMAMREPSKSLISYLENNDEQEKIHVDERFEENSVAAFGILEAKRHRSRGIQFDMFLGLTKLLRQAFVDLIYETKLDNEQCKKALAITHRFWDKFELGFSSEWMKNTEGEKITELQETNRDLTNQKNRYHTIIQSIAEPVFVIDKQMNIIETNASFNKIFGIGCGSDMKFLFEKTSLPHFGERFMADYNRGISFVEEVDMLLNNEKCTFIVSGSALDDISGKNYGAIISLLDITERKQAEEVLRNTHEELERRVAERTHDLVIAMEELEHEVAERMRAEQALRESEKRYHTLFEESPDGVLIIDTAGKIIEFNETAHSQLGYSREEFKKLSLSDIDPVESPEEIQDKINSMLKEGKVEFDVKHRTKEGEIRDVQVVTQPIELSGQTFFHAIWLDITERKLAEERLRKTIMERGRHCCVSCITGQKII